MRPRDRGGDPGRVNVSWIELAWVLFAVGNVIAMLVFVNEETVPFHLVWVSFTVLYGFRMWPWRPTLLVLGVVCLVTGGALVQPVTDGQLSLQEAFEVPLMAAIFLVMAWHVRRRQEAMDLAERMTTQERQALRRERAFLRDASHELRTPITIARGHLELVQQTTLPTAAAADMTVALGELDRLGRLSDRLLTLARLDHPNPLRLQQVDLADLVALAAQRWSAVTHRQWAVDVGADGDVLADPERIQSALDALIENAIAHTAEGGRIVLRLHTADGAATIEVSDDGEGIEPKHLDLVFDRFWRAPSSAPARRGSGLGLAIVRAIAQAHGGSVGVRNRIGGGATFWLRLPRRVETSDQPTTPTGPEPLTAVTAG